MGGAASKETGEEDGKTLEARRNSSLRTVLVIEETSDSTSNCYELAITPSDVSPARSTETAKTLSTTDPTEALLSSEDGTPRALPAIAPLQLTDEEEDSSDSEEERNCNPVGPSEDEPFRPEDCKKAVEEARIKTAEEKDGDATLEKASILRSRPRADDGLFCPAPLDLDASFSSESEETDGDPSNDRHTSSKTVETVGKEAAKETRSSGETEGTQDSRVIEDTKESGATEEIGGGESSEEIRDSYELEKRDEPAEMGDSQATEEVRKRETTKYMGIVVENCRVVDGKSSSAATSFFASEVSTTLDTRSRDTPEEQGKTITGKQEEECTAEKASSNPENWSISPGSDICLLGESGPPDVRKPSSNPKLGDVPSSIFIDWDAPTEVPLTESLEHVPYHSIALHDAKCKPVFMDRLRRKISRKKQPHRVRLNDMDTECYQLTLVEL